MRILDNYIFTARIIKVSGKKIGILIPKDTAEEIMKKDYLGKRVIIEVKIVTPEPPKMG